MQGLFDSAVDDRVRSAELNPASDEPLLKLFRL